MAVAPVADQRLYDSIYQERYMGLPQDNAEGYKAGSPINYAEGLRGSLLLVHGSGDDNVHYQGSELLVNRLIELEKPFDFMTYPGRTHALVEGKGRPIIFIACWRGTSKSTSQPALRSIRNAFLDITYDIVVVGG